MSRKPKAAVVITEIGKVCTGCGEDKPLTEYGKQAASPLGLRSKCKSCCRADHREWRARLSPDEVATYRARATQWFEENPGARRNSHLRRKFGITLADYEAMLARQGGRCAICSGIDSGDRRFETFAVDHDHATGRVRALLCAPCNKAIGLMQDNPDRLMAAAAYLLQTRNLLEVPR